METAKPVKTLVVDDDEDDLYLITEALGEVPNTRYAITTASSVLAGMACLAKESFDVIFSDYRLGPATGVDFIRSVRQAGIETPVILLTGLADHVIDEAAMKAGASDFVPKTAIHADVLDRSVRYALAHAERQRLLQAVLKSTISGVAVLDKDNQLLLSNPKLVEFAAGAFGKERGHLDQLIACALAATEKDIAIGERVVEAHITALPDGGRVLVLHDVTQRVNELKERELAEQRIRKIAMQDALTGLPNRLAFNDYLDTSLAAASAGKTRVAVLSFDFNRFKELNDLWGHAAGDELLKSAARRLGFTLLNREYAARLGGDEFVLVQDNSSEEDALKLAHRVVESLAVPIKWGLKTITGSVSLGIAFYPEHGHDRQELLANADLAMYRAKSEDAGPVCVFDSSMDQFVRERRKIAYELRSAFKNELSLHFQPQFNVETRELSGFESLLRWKSPVRGFVSPADFIPVAEETGLINELDEWVLRRACESLASWPTAPRMAVNISAKAICQVGIVNTVRAIVLETGISPARLELEVTETALVHDLNRALHNLRQIKAFGISIAMDDFGTGYSSLSLLNAFPFDRIKIDKSFVQLASSNERADAMFRSVINLGAALRVPVLVEGVETGDQDELITATGCEEVQGYFYGRPIAYDDASAMLECMRASGAKNPMSQWQGLYAGLKHERAALSA